MRPQAKLIGEIQELKMKLSQKTEICSSYEKQMDDYSKEIKHLKKLLNISNVSNSFVYDSDHTPEEDLSHFCSYNQIDEESKKELISIIEGFAMRKIPKL